MNNKVILDWSDLNCHDVTEIKLVVDNSDRTLIEGTVLDINNNPVPNAAIEMIRVNKDTNIEEIIGCVFTDVEGKYAFTKKISSKYYYYFKLYSSL